MQKILPLALLALIVAGSAEFAQGCRFNVRETGFVDLGFGSFLFLCYTDSSTSGNFVSSFEETAERTFAETNVGFELVDTETQKEHPAMKYLDDQEETSFPSCVLLSPQGLVMSAGFELPADAEGQSIESVALRAVDSPLRATLVRELSRVYGVVLLIEGVEASENARAKRVAEQAIEETEAQMKYMPKPISYGPVLVTVKRDSIPQERVVLWSLGLEGEDLLEPHVAVLYGKGRWIGPVLRGSEIEEQILYNILSVIGADCECGLDPRLIRGTPLPVRWDGERQAEVAKDLGFDPDNPMIKIEVSQILKLRSTLYPMASSRPQASLDDLPVPFVEDRDSNPMMKNVLLALAGLVGIVLIVGLVMVGRAKRKKR